MSYGIAGLAASLSFVAALSGCDEPVAKVEPPARTWHLSPTGVGVLDGRTG